MAIRIRWLLAVSMTLIALVPATAQQPATEATDAERQAAAERLATMQALAQTCILTKDGSAKPYTLEPKPLLRWSNPISGMVDGSLWLWTDNGRPVATIDIFIGKTWSNWNHQSQSLAADSFECRRNGQIRWSPRRPGRSFKPVPDGPVPAKTPEQRLVQMRALARQFLVEDDFKTQFRGTEFQTHELRLLAQPLYRYGGEGQAVKDGALFGYVLATACEALLLLEVHETDGQLAWHYSFAGQTCYEVRAKHNDEVVFTQPCWDTAFDPTNPYFAFSAAADK